MWKLHNMTFIRSGVWGRSPHLPLDTLYRTMQPDMVGMSRSESIEDLLMECPRRGFITLRTKIGQEVTLPTACHSWGCFSCKNKLTYLTKKRIALGVSMEEPSFLITVTYRTVGQDRQDVVSVRKDWTALLRCLKPKNGTLRWFRVIEATKRGQPHIHLLIAGIGNRVACCRKIQNECSHPVTKRYIQQFCEVNCLEHEWGKHWLDITGDSFVVDARLSYGINGAASYLAKYLAKSLSAFEALNDLGFKRRFSTSRNWRGFDRLRLSVTIREQWEEKRLFAYERDGAVDSIRAAAAASVDSPVLTRVGTDVAFGIAEKEVKEAHKGVIKRFLKNTRGVGNASDRPAGQS